ncbi:MAG: adenylate/guanylate cyclase domain-containing protein [Deltaproteobacteria bacterium]|nr:adenylate/guanylate cyclase domain-containing protein [Deltaproteobacteria bacterium]
MVIPAWARTWWAVPAALALLWALAIAVPALAGSPMPAEAVTWGWIPLALYQAAVMARVVARADLERRVRWAWAAMLVGTVLGLGGDAIWLVMTEAGESPGFVHLADVVYLAEYPAWVVGFLLLPVERKPGSGVAATLDLLTVTAAASVAMWDAVLRPLASAYADDPAALVLSGGPVVGDVILLATITALLSRRPRPTIGGPLVLLAFAMLLSVVIDLVYVAEELAETYLAGGALDVGWVVSRALISLAALRQLAPAADPRAVERAARLLERGSMIVPLLAMGLGFVLIVVAVLRENADDGTTGTAVGAALLCLLVLARQTYTAIMNALLARRLRAETDKSDRLLRNILPDTIAAQLKEGRPTEPLAESFPAATVVFADLVGFTPLSATIPPDRLVGLLDEVFSRFDAIADRHGLEKIKTIGDAYMVAAGVPLPRPDHAHAAARAALEMRDALDDFARERGVQLEARVGIHTGPLVAGVIGQRKFAYDLWGDTVNTASRMESHSAPGKIHVTEAVRLALGDRFVCEPRGDVDIKGKGVMSTHFLVSEVRPAGAA